MYFNFKVNFSVLLAFLKISLRIVDLFILNFANLDILGWFLILLI